MSLAAGQNDEEPKVVTMADPGAPLRGTGRRWLRRIGRTFFLSLGVVVAALAGTYFYLSGGRFVTTENASVRADKVAVSAFVPGTVVEVAVSENQRVREGDLLFRIDDEPYLIALDRAEAQMKRVVHEVAALRASYRQKQEELKLAQTTAAYYGREFARHEELAERKVVSVMRLDEVRHSLDVARNQVAARRQELSRILAGLGGEPDLAAARHPDYLEAKARKEQADFELRRTIIMAPASGIIGNVALRPGDYAKTGVPLISLIETGYIWIEANIKETDMTYVAVGQPATIRVDAYPDREWPAEVKSLSPATGSEFALLPAQNATGNWVKVVQRVPVKFRLVGDGDTSALRIGMSVRVEIDTGHQRVLPDFTRTALGWITGTE